MHNKTLSIFYSIGSRYYSLNIGNTITLVGLYSIKYIGIYNLLTLNVNYYLL